LELLPGTSDLVALTIEGSSSLEEAHADVKAGEEVIDVGFYYGSESIDAARLIRYVQLKHSTRNSSDWTASGLAKTIAGFARRYAELRTRFSQDSIPDRFAFEFRSNRPIAPSVEQALRDLATGAPQHDAKLCQLLASYAKVGDAEIKTFFAAFRAAGDAPDLWAQRHLLREDIRGYLADLDYDAPVQLKELVTKKATTEFELDPSIRRHDVLRALNVTEEQLRPAPSLIPPPTGSIPREQEESIRALLLSSSAPLIIHAEAGAGKSVLAARLASSLPSDSQAVLYDCFGDGLYRSTLHFRHRHRDALVQIANELSSRSLCHPIIPSAHADNKSYMRAFVHRVTQAITLLRAQSSNASLVLVVDAADNAEAAAEENRDSASFVKDLIRTPMPPGVRLAFTCRTHRQNKLAPPPNAIRLELKPFSEAESRRYLRETYPSATESEALEFHVLTSFNPRVQALVISQSNSLADLLKQLGPNPTTVNDAIGQLLSTAIERMIEQWGPSEAGQIELICRCIGILRPLVPISLVSSISGIAESAVRSFALDLGRPLLVKGDSLHFRDEPTETWFRETFRPDAAQLSQFLGRLRPLASTSSYAAATLPHLLLEADQLDELVNLALSATGLPSDNPLAKRDVELQRLTFALKACLQRDRRLPAAKIALKAAGETAAEKRQTDLIQDNTDLAAALLAPDRLEEIVSRRTFGSAWMGSHHAYDAGLLSGRQELHGEASSRLRMAMDWLNSWARLSAEERAQEEITTADRAELALALLRLRGAASAAQFLRGWTWRRFSFEAGARLSAKLVDLGDFKSIDELAIAAGNDVWLLLALAEQSQQVRHCLPIQILNRLLRLLADRRVLLAESSQWGAKYSVLEAVTAAVEMAAPTGAISHGKLATILRRYLPKKPPEQLTDRYGFNRTPVIRAYAVESSLRGVRLSLQDIAPESIRKELDEKPLRYSRSQESVVFSRLVGGQINWLVLHADIICGHAPLQLDQAIQAALKETAASESELYQDPKAPRQVAATTWLRILRDTSTTAAEDHEAFKAWLNQQDEPLWPDTLITICREAARAAGFSSIALEWAPKIFDIFEKSREDAESRLGSYVKLARAIYALSREEAALYFDRAVEISSRIGEENLDRWSALLRLANAASERDQPRPRTAYRLARMAELTYEYVVRDKYFDWRGTVKAITKLCGASSLAILSRWRDRRFGDPGRLLPVAIYMLVDAGYLPDFSPAALAGIEAEWDRVDDLKRSLASADAGNNAAIRADIAYRYIRVLPGDEKMWEELRQVSQTSAIEFLDVDRLARFCAKYARRPQAPEQPRLRDSSARRSPNWDEIFHGVDLTSPGELRKAYDSLRTYDPPYNFERFFAEAYARAGANAAALIRGIVEWPTFGVFELSYLLGGLPTPLPRLLSTRKAIRAAVLAACRVDPVHVRRSGWDSIVPFARLYEDGIVEDADVVRATLEGYTQQLEYLDASALFRLVEPLSTLLSPVEADEALNFGLDLFESDFHQDDGDGPWRPEIEPPLAVLSAAAGYIWAGLSSPVSAERWQFAHCVRSFVEIGWQDMVHALIDHANSGVGGPFVDKRLEFYVWHARQWLLVGLARGGLANPDCLASAKPFILKAISEEHVLIRNLAAQALSVLVTGGSSENASVDLREINRPTRGTQQYKGWVDSTEDDPEIDEPHGDDQFFFGIDIGPYWFQPLGRAFGLLESVIERRARRAIRIRVGAPIGGWKEDARYTRRIFSDGETHHSHGTLPKTDDLRAYQAYHAMMMVAADLLRHFRVRKDEDEDEDEFVQWLRGYRLTRDDGKWVADRRDPKLIPPPQAPSGYGDKDWQWAVTSDYLLAQLVTDDGITSVWGHWSTDLDRHTETVSVQSALVSKVAADSLIAALQTASDLARFSLPCAGDTDELESQSLIMTGWILDRADALGLDEQDPWASRMHYPCPSPSNEVVSRLGLSQSPDGRLWFVNGTETYTRGETWTQVQGYGREQETVPGYRLSASTEFIKHLLAVYADMALIVRVAVRRDSRRLAAEEHGDVYPSPYVRYFKIGEDGVAESL
jgi:hypothetical protein